MSIPGADNDTVFKHVQTQLDCVLDLEPPQEGLSPRLSEALATEKCEENAARALALTRIDPFLLTRPDPLLGLAAWHVKERRGPAAGRTVWAGEMARDMAPLMRND